MRAKEYAKKFNDAIAPFSNPEKMNEMIVTKSMNEMVAMVKQEISFVLTGMLNEFLELAKTRGAKSSDAFYACWVETETKWEAFLKLVKNKRFPFKKENLRNTLHEALPDLDEALCLIEMRKRLIKDKPQDLKLIGIDLGKEALDEETKRANIQ